MEYQLLTPTIPIQSNISPLELVFANRGIFPEDVNHYLHTTREDILEPTLLDNIETGAKMFIKHLAAGDKIFVQADSDADGYTSAAAIINYANMIAPGMAQQNISYRIHDGKQHGIILDKIPDDIKLLIMPDAASNDYEQHKILKEKGIDILILDHHEADMVSEDACVINNQLCNYPNKTLSGVGIVYKFCQYIDSLIGKSYADELLDLVAVGMVADMMDLRNFETKELIDIGSHHLRNPFITAFVSAQAYSLKGEVTPFGISFYIAPYINAVIRIGTYDEKMLLFESMLDFRGYEQIPSTKRGCKGQYETRVEQACRVCKNIKSRQTKARDTSLDLINQMIQEQHLLDHPIIIIQLDEPVEENLTGLIANQIMGTYMRPVLLLNKCVENNKVYWRGSGRNATYSKLTNLREFLEESGLVEFAQGHASAFGVSVEEELLPALKNYIDEKLKGFDFSNCYRVDFIWQANLAEQYKDQIIDLGRLESIWGQGLPKPQVAIEGIQVHKDNLILMSPDKKPTLKIILPGNLSLIKFGASQEEFDKLYSETGTIVLNVVGTCNVNDWNGITSAQLLIEDYEVVGKNEYCF